MKRVVTALVLIPLVVWVVLAAPFRVFAAVVAAVGLLAFHEFDQIAKAQGIPPAGWPGMAAGLVLLFTPEPFVGVAIAALAALMLARNAVTNKKYDDAIGYLDWVIAHRVGELLRTGFDEAAQPADGEPETPCQRGGDNTRCIVTGVRNVIQETV